ncbi:MAG TPA: potassium transporter, partial [Stenotrophomonas sp.]|nr:potassium transporter [Stenotrophomonas sp.]
LLGLFFITIGMLLDVHTLIDHWFLVLLLLTGPVLLKFGLIAALSRLFGSSTGVALRTGLALAQAGEFGFVLLNQAGGLKLIDPLLIQVILASMVLSMLAAPFILAKSDAIVMKLSANEWMLQSLALTQLATRTMSAQKHVIIAGFGRSGQSLARLLEEEGITYHALEMDPELVQDARSGGANVSYGDAARRESLVAAGIHRAAALVVTYASTPSALKVLHHAAELAPELPVIVRSYDDADLDKLLAAGATEVVPESLEGSLMLASHALVMLGVPLRRVVHRVQAAREERYASLRGYFPGITDAEEETDPERLHTVTLTGSASSVGRSLGSVDVAGCGAEVASIRRGKGGLEVAPETVLQAGDVVVLRGEAEAVNRAEQRLLR